MRLKLSEWAERTYTDASRPAMPTLRKMADDGEIAGAFQTKSGRWFVDVGPSSISTDELVRREMDRRNADVIRQKHRTFCKHWKSRLPKPKDVIAQRVQKSHYIDNRNNDTGQAVYFLIGADTRVSYVGVALSSVRDRLIYHVNAGKIFHSVCVREYDDDDVANWIEHICIDWYGARYNIRKGKGLPNGFDSKLIARLPDISRFVARCSGNVVYIGNFSALDAAHE